MKWWYTQTQQINEKLFLIMISSLFLEYVVSLSLKFKSEVGSQDGSKLWHDHLTKVGFLHNMVVNPILFDFLMFFLSRSLLVIAWMDRQFPTWCMAWKLVGNWSFRLILALEQNKWASYLLLRRVSDLFASLGGLQCMYTMTRNVLNLEAQNKAALIKYSYQHQPV